MDTFRAVLTIVVLVGVAVFILLLEKKRAQRIEGDLRNAARERRAGQREQRGRRGR